MKKTIAMLCAVIMLAITAFAGLTMAAEADLTGEWNLQSMEQGGVQMDAAILSLLGMNMVLTLNEDGTATLDMSAGGAENGTWTPDGTIMFDGQEAHFTLGEDGTLVLEEADQNMVFSRESAGADSKLAPAVAVTDISDFEGTWNATTFVALGMALPLESAGAQISLTIADGKAAVSEAVMDLENDGEIVDSMEAEFEVTLQEDGTLYIDFAGENVLAQLSIEADGMNLTLHEDGRMSGTVPETEAEAVIVEAEETTDETGDSSADSSGDSGDGGSSGGESTEPDMYLILEKAE